MPTQSAEQKRLEIAKEELRIVRTFLRRNRLNEMYTVLQLVGDNLYGAKAITGSIPVTTSEDVLIPFQNVEWGPDGFFNGGEPTRLTVPEGLGGRYFVQEAVRWHNPEQSVAPPKS